MEFERAAYNSVFNIVPYVGGDVLPDGIIREVGLCSNENPFGLSERVIKAVANAASNAWRYPSGSAELLRQAIAKKHNLKAQNIVCGNGSEELLHLLARCFAASGDEVLIPQHAFNVYKIATLAAGAIPVTINRDHFILNPETVVKLVTPKTKMFFLDHPGNPIGNFIKKDDLYQLIKSLPSSIIIVLDAAYAEFLTDNADYECGHKFVDEFPNVVVVRSFSKAYGLAGLRLGWLHAQDQLLAILNRVRAPFNVNSLAQIAGIEALLDDDFIKKTVENNNALLIECQQKLKSMGYSIIDCCTNFTMMDCGDRAHDIYMHLAKQGVIVRPMKAYDLPTYLRVSIGTSDQMEKFFTVLESFK